MIKENKKQKVVFARSGMQIEMKIEKLWSKTYFYP